MLVLSESACRKIESWFANNPLLYVVIYQDGNSPDKYFTHNVEEIKALIDEHMTTCYQGFVITIFAENPFRIQGHATKAFVSSALDRFSDGTWIHIVSLERQYPQVTKYWADNERDILLSEFFEYDGLQVGIGEEPFDKHDVFPDNVAITLKYSKQKLNANQ